MSKYGMDFTGHTPKFGRKLHPGTYLAELAAEQFQARSDKNPKGNRIVVTFKVLEGNPEDLSKGPQHGATGRVYLYILDDDFAGSEEHAGATKDNWYHILVAAGVEPGSYSDMRKVAKKLVGTKMGIVAETDSKNPEYTNIQEYFPAAAWGDAPASDVPGPDAMPVSAVDDPEPDDSDDEGDEFDLAGLT